MDEAIAGALPTPNDTPRPIAEGGSDFIATTQQGSVGRAFNAAIEQSFTEINAQMESLMPGGTNNPYGNTPMADVYYNVMAGLGPAGCHKEN